MTKEAIIKKTVRTLNILPPQQAEEIADFVDFMLKKYEESILQNGIEKLAEQSGTFDFLNDDEDLYSEEDIIEKY